MLYVWECSGCHKVSDRFEHHPSDKGTETYLCDCGHSMGPVTVTGGVPLLWAEEGRERQLPNLNRIDPETGKEIPHRPIRSWRDYQKAKQEAGVTEAGPRRGEPGRWI